MLDVVENTWIPVFVRGLIKALSGVQSLHKEEQEGLMGVHVKVFVIFNRTPHSKLAQHGLSDILQK